MQRKEQFTDELLALPLGASRPDLPELPLPHWPAMDYRWIFQQLHCWGLAKSAPCLPLCPLCAGVAYYQGSGFTRCDIATGWRSYMICSTGSFPHPLITTLLANMGVPVHMAPQVLVQLRPIDLGNAQVLPDDDTPGALPGLNLRNDEPHVIDGFCSLWRGIGPRAVAMAMAQNILSISLSCSRRLCIRGLSLEDLGFTAFFCEQVNKTACTSRTRVGRYLDDQPARAPRAHVYGAHRADAFEKLPEDSWEVDRKPREASDPPEGCPFCGAPGRLLRSELLTLLPWEVEMEAVRPASDDDQQAASFHGHLWICGRHLWGWRIRRAGVPVTMD